MFDAIVIGSGISGGWAAKELCERGLKTLVLERGPHIEHGTDYADMKQPWELPNFGMVPEAEEQQDYPIQSNCYAFSSASKQFFVKDSDHPYTFPEERPFEWIRGHHLGGRSVTWGRQTYRMSEMDFSANARDGHGSDWPIRYADLAPWYDHVEDFIGVSGSLENLPQLPDGQFLPAMGLTDAETDFKSVIESRFDGRTLIPGRCAHLSEAKPHHQALGRAPCQYRATCERGCSFGAYFSTLSSTLPAARNTGNLTVVTDAIVDSLIFDPKSRRITGVKVIDRNSRKRQVYEARVVFLCASTVGTAQILLNSRSDATPDGVANSSGAVGRYLMDHVSDINSLAVYPGFEDRYYHGRRPTGFYIPRYQNLTDTRPFLRGFAYQGTIMRRGWKPRAATASGIGAELKKSIRTPGPWMLWMTGYGEMLPNPNNRVTLDFSRTDQWGMPIPHIDCSYGENEDKIIAQAYQDARDMISAAGATQIPLKPKDGKTGTSIHEMGTAHMGSHPDKSVLNKYNQAHDAPNLFITDGSAMASGGCQNPSLTYMALSARGAFHATQFLKDGLI